jgi:neutral ceramidase
LRQTGIEMANQMTPGAIPQPPPAPPYRSVWSYGNLPPELR